jgi:hypothetical protein
MLLVPLFCAAFFGSAELHALPPLLNVNSSLYGIEVPASTLAVGDNFTVELHIRNATTSNVQFGVNGIEAHFSFANVLNYSVPIGYADFLGKPGGILNAPLLNGINPGFYASNGTRINGPPFIGAVDYEAAAASFGESWNYMDGVIANLTFQITRQPRENETSVSLSLDFSYLEVDTTYIANPWTNETLPLQVFPESISGNLVLDSSYKPPANYELIAEANPPDSGTVSVKVDGITQTAPFVFVEGTKVQISSIPNTGYAFSNWTLDNAFAGSDNPYNLTMGGNHTLSANFSNVTKPANLLPVTLTAEPVVMPPLTSISTNPFDLEIPSTRVAVGDRFVVELHLRNATAENVPLGLGSVELHFYFGNISSYLRPVRFSNLLGASEGILNPAVEFTISPEYHTLQGNSSAPPYDDAMSYDVAARSTGTGWKGIDGLIANLTFEIVRQPQASLSENGISFPMDFTMTQLNDSAGQSIECENVNTTITLDSVCHDVEITNVALSQNVVGEGFPLCVNVTLANLGSVTEEDVLVTLYANTSVLDYQAFTLVSGNITNVTFERNTTGFAKGRYVLNVTIEGPQDEANTTVNYSAGILTITIPGDIDGNGRVSLADLVQVARVFQTHVGESVWDPNADIDCNGIVDSREISIVASHYGESTP